MGTCFRIKELRQSAGLTQAQLAFRLDLRSPSTVTMWGDRRSQNLRAQFFRALLMYLVFLLMLSTRIPQAKSDKTD